MQTCRRFVPQSKTSPTEIDHLAISPTGLRVAVEAHGEILTVAAKHGPTRDITNTTGVMERRSSMVAWTANP